MALDGQKIVVIGGSSGMGLATARAAALDGAEVTIASSRQERVDAALGELPDGCVGRALDVRDETGRRLLARRRVRSPGVHRRRRIHAASTCRPQPQRRGDPRRSLLGCGRRHQARSAPDQARRINRVDHRHRRPATGPRRSACRRRRERPRASSGDWRSNSPRPCERGQGRRFSHAALGPCPRGLARGAFCPLGPGHLNRNGRRAGANSRRTPLSHAEPVRHRNGQTVDGGLLLAGN